jgi:hypothetical protein
MTYKRIAARRTAADFRAHVAAPGAALPFDATLVQPLPLAHGRIFPSGNSKCRRFSGIGLEALAGFGGNESYAPHRLKPRIRVHSEFLPSRFPHNATFGYIARSYSA